MAGGEELGFDHACGHDLVLLQGFEDVVVSAGQAVGYFVEVACVRAWDSLRAHLELPPLATGGELGEAFVQGLYLG